MKILWRQNKEENRKQKSQKENEECSKKVKGEKLFKYREISVIWVGSGRIRIEIKS